jgi:hypothetical protein
MNLDNKSVNFSLENTNVEKGKAQTNKKAKNKSKSKLSKIERSVNFNEKY